MKTALNHNAKDLTGMTFGRWTVIEFAGRTKHRNLTWLCRCECGVVKVVSSGSLRTGGSLSCGCLNDEVCTKHGQCDTPAYSAWHGMIQRCTNPKFKQFKDYGGRGISVCERWMAFSNFVDDMGQPPSDCQIDRIDNDGDYEPGNCKWSTRKENMRNRRCNRMLALNGVTKCMSDWADDLGMNSDTIRDRLRRGWTVEKALTTPVETKFRGVA